MGRLWRLVLYADTGWSVLNWLGAAATVVFVPIAVSVSAWADEQPAFIVILAATLAFAWASLALLIVGHCFGWLHTRFFPTKDRKGRLFREVFNQHRSGREEFWRYFEGKYADYQQENHGIPDALKELVDDARVPDMPLGQTHIAIWIRSNKTWWDESTQQLFKFARSFYPEADRASPADAQAHQHRALQAKFWDCWALRTKHLDRHTYKIVREAAQNNLRDCKLLYFLELAQDLQKNKMTAGKSGLYALVQEIW